MIRRGALLCCVSEKFRKREWLWIRRGEYEDFPSIVFCLTVLKNFVGEPFRVSLISGIEYFMLQRVLSRFLSYFFVSQCRKFM